MGSSLSSLLSKAYMQYCETSNTLNNKIYNRYMLADFRYVDDTFMVFNGTKKTSRKYCQLLKL